MLFDKEFVPDIALYKFPQADKTDLVTIGIVIEVPLLYGPKRNHFLIHMSTSEESQKSNSRNQDVDKNVPDIVSEMLTES